MKKRNLILCIIIFFMMVSSARAENWVNVAKAKDNSVIAYVDEDSITVDGNKRKFWIK